MKVLYFVIVIGILSIIVLYSPIGSPDLYVNSSTYGNTIYNTKSSNDINFSNLKKSVSSDYTDNSSDSNDDQSVQLSTESSVKMPSSNFETSPIKSSTYTSTSQTYSKNNSQLSDFQSVTLLYSGNKSTTESGSGTQFTPMNNSVTTNSSNNDAAIYANGPSKCEPVTCGHWVWIDGYWSYCGYHKEWHDGYWEWVDEECPPAVPVGDGFGILTVLLIIYLSFKLSKHEKNNNISGNDSNNELYFSSENESSESL